MAVVEESPSPVKSGLLNWRWSQIVDEQARLTQSRDGSPVPYEGLLLRKKTLEAIASREQLPETIHCVNSGASRPKTCVKNVPCAGHALRNAFLSNGQENWKAHVKLARIIKRSYVGLELVRWLMEQCAFVQSRGAAAGVWNILLELDILLSVERQSMFEDSGALYQFSFEECEAQSCDFRNQSQWQNGVSFLLQLVPHTQLHVDTYKQCDGESRRSPEVCGRVAQMRALERLTSTVRKVCSAAALLKPNTLHNSATIGLVRQFRCSACSQRRKARECPRRTACLLCVTFVDFCGHRDGPASAELNRPVPAALQVVMFGAFIQYVRYQGRAECALPPAIKVMSQNCPAR